MSSVFGGEDWGGFGEKVRQREDCFLLIALNYRKSFFKLTIVELPIKFVILQNILKYEVMIVDFSVGNFKSIKDIQTLSMTAAPIVSNPKYEDVDKNNVFKVNDKLSLLKSKAVYGANASGKSNLVKGLTTFISVVNESVKDEIILNKQIEPFKLSTSTEKKPSYFQLSFFVEGVYYRYGFEATNNEIVSEWLFGTPGKKEVPFFTRSGMKIQVNKNAFIEGNKISGLYIKKGNDIARKNSLFLTALKSFGGKISTKLVDYISSIIIVSSDHSEYMRAQALDSLNDETIKNQIVSFLNIADTGIENIQKFEFSREDLPNIHLTFYNKKFLIVFDLYFESEEQTKVQKHHLNTHI